MTTLTQEQFAALLREAFLVVASKAYEARQIGMSEEQMLVLLAPAMEPVVQMIIRKLARP